MISISQRVARGLRNGTLWNSMRMRMPPRTGARLERLLRCSGFLCGAALPMDVMKGPAASMRTVVGRTVGLEPAEPVRLMPGFTPCGFDVATTDRFAVVSTTARATLPIELAGEACGRARFLHVRSLDELRRHPHRWRQQFQQFPGLFDEPANHDDGRLRAAVLAHAAASGLPVSVREEGDLCRWLPWAVVNQWVSTDPKDLLDPALREQIAWRQWSSVHDQLPCDWEPRVEPGCPGRRKKSLSVLIATRRPELVEFWAMQLAAQRDVHFEVIAALHGPGFSEADEAVARNWLGDRLNVIRAPRNQVLGDVLNQAAAVASGELLIKWDDDDLYGSGHLGDLERAHAWSGAALTGKPVRCLYFCDGDVTVQVRIGPAERYGSIVAGNTLCLSREVLAEAGGWRKLPHTVDSRLIEDVVRAGGAVYRASGFGHVVLRMNRSSHQHTWRLSRQQFDSRSESRLPGLCPEMALVDTPPGLLENLTGLMTGRDDRHRAPSRGDTQLAGDCPSPQRSPLPQQVAAVDDE